MEDLVADLVAEADKKQKEDKGAFAKKMFTPTLNLRSLDELAFVHINLNHLRNLSRHVKVLHFLFYTSIAQIHTLIAEKCTSIKWD